MRKWLKKQMDKLTSPELDWVQVEISTLDLNLRRRPRGDRYSYSTSILVGLPWTAVSESLIDYTQPTSWPGASPPEVQVNP